ncbi:MAG: hypothetical protein AAF228_01270 [Pseudomonadota bacterium]
MAYDIDTSYTLDPSFLKGSSATEFQDTISDESLFLDALRQTFGDGISETKAEGIRQKLMDWLKGNDADALPEMVFVKESALPQGVYAGYFAGNQQDPTAKFFISEALMDGVEGDIELTDVLIEEIGHYLDAELNDVDTKGDEGAKWRAVVTNDDNALANLNPDEIDTVSIDYKGKTYEIEAFSDKAVFDTLIGDKTKQSGLVLNKDISLSADKYLAVDDIGRSDPEGRVILTAVKMNDKFSLVILNRHTQQFFNIDLSVSISDPGDSSISKLSDILILDSNGALSVRDGYHLDFKEGGKVTVYNNTSGAAIWKNYTHTTKGLFANYSSVTGTTIDSSSILEKTQKLQNVHNDLTVLFDTDSEKYEVYVFNTLENTGAFVDTSSAQDFLAVHEDGSLVMLADYQLELTQIGDIIITDKNDGSRVWMYDRSANEIHHNYSDDTTYDILVNGGTDTRPGYTPAIPYMQPIREFVSTLDTFNALFGVPDVKSNLHYGDVLDHTQVIKNGNLVFGAVQHLGSYNTSDDTARYDLVVYNEATGGIQIINENDSPFGEFITFDSQTGKLSVTEEHYALTLDGTNPDSPLSIDNLTLQSFFGNKQLLTIDSTSSAKDTLEGGESLDNDHYMKIAGSTPDDGNLYFGLVLGEWVVFNDKTNQFVSVDFHTYDTHGDKTDELVDGITIDNGALIVGSDYRLEFEEGGALKLEQKSSNTNNYNETWSFQTQQKTFFSDYQVVDSLDPSILHKNMTLSGADKQMLRAEGQDAAGNAQSAILTTVYNTNSGTYEVYVLNEQTQTGTFIDLSLAVHAGYLEIDSDGLITMDSKYGLTLHQDGRVEITNDHPFWSFDPSTQVITTYDYVLNNNFDTPNSLDPVLGDIPYSPHFPPIRGLASTADILKLFTEGRNAHSPKSDYLRHGETLSSAEYMRDGNIYLAAIDVSDSRSSSSYELIMYNADTGESDTVDVAQYPELNFDRAHGTLTLNEERRALRLDENASQKKLYATGYQVDGTVPDDGLFFFGSKKTTIEQAEEQGIDFKVASGEFVNRYFIDSKFNDGDGFTSEFVMVANPDGHEEHDKSVSFASLKINGKDSFIIQNDTTNEFVVVDFAGSEGLIFTDTDGDGGNDAISVQDGYRLVFETGGALVVQKDDGNGNFETKWSFELNDFEALMDNRSTHNSSGAFGVLASEDTLSQSEKLLGYIGSTSNIAEAAVFFNTEVNANLLYVFDYDAHSGNFVDLSSATDYVTISDSGNMTMESGYSLELTNEGDVNIKDASDAVVWSYDNESKTIWGGTSGGTDGAPVDNPYTFYEADETPPIRGLFSPSDTMDFLFGAEPKVHEPVANALAYGETLEAGTVLKDEDVVVGSMLYTDEEGNQKYILGMYDENGQFNLLDPTSDFYGGNLLFDETTGALSIANEGYVLRIDADNDFIYVTSDVVNHALNGDTLEEWQEDALIESTTAVWEAMLTSAGGVLPKWTQKQLMTFVYHATMLGQDATTEYTWDQFFKHNEALFNDPSIINNISAPDFVKLVQDGTILLDVFGISSTDTQKIEQFQNVINISSLLSYSLNESHKRAFSAQSGTDIIDSAGNKLATQDMVLPYNRDGTLGINEAQVNFVNALGYDIDFLNQPTDYLANRVEIGDTFTRTDGVEITVENEDQAKTINTRNFEYFLTALESGDILDGKVKQDSLRKHSFTQTLMSTAREANDIMVAENNPYWNRVDLDSADVDTDARFKVSYTVVGQDGADDKVIKDKYVTQEQMDFLEERQGKKEITGLTDRENAHITDRVLLQTIKAIETLADYDALRTQQLDPETGKIKGAPAIVMWAQAFSNHHKTLVEGTDDVGSALTEKDFDYTKWNAKKAKYVTHNHHGTHFERLFGGHIDAGFAQSDITGKAFTNREAIDYFFNEMGIEDPGMLSTSVTTSFSDMLLLAINEVPPVTDMVTSSMYFGANYPLQLDWDTLNTNVPNGHFWWHQDSMGGTLYNKDGDYLEDYEKAQGVRDIIKGWIGDRAAYANRDLDLVEYLSHKSISHQRYVETKALWTEIEIEILIDFGAAIIGAGVGWAVGALIGAVAAALTTEVAAEGASDVASQGVVRGTAYGGGEVEMSNLAERTALVGQEQLEGSFEVEGGFDEVPLDDIDDAAQPLNGASPAAREAATKSAVGYALNILSPATVAGTEAVAYGTDIATNINDIFAPDADLDYVTAYGYELGNDNYTGTDFEIYKAVDGEPLEEIKSYDGAQYSSGTTSLRDNVSAVNKAIPVLDKYAEAVGDDPANPDFTSVIDTLLNEAKDAEGNVDPEMLQLIISYMPTYYEFDDAGNTISKNPKVDIVATLYQYDIANTVGQEKFDAVISSPATADNGPVLHALSLPSTQYSFLEQTYNANGGADIADILNDPSVTSDDIVNILTYYIDNKSEYTGYSTGDPVDYPEGQPTPWIIDSLVALNEVNEDKVHDVFAILANGDDAAIRVGALVSNEIQYLTTPSDPNAPDNSELTLSMLHGASFSPKNTDASGNSMGMASMYSIIAELDTLIPPPEVQERRRTQGGLVTAAGVGFALAALSQFILGAGALSYAPSTPAGIRPRTAEGDVAGLLTRNRAEQGGISLDNGDNYDDDVEALDATQEQKDRVRAEMADPAARSEYSSDPNLGIDSFKINGLKTNAAKIIDYADNHIYTGSDVPPRWTSAHKTYQDIFLGIDDTPLDNPDQDVYTQKVGLTLNEVANQGRADIVAKIFIDVIRDFSNNRDSVVEWMGYMSPANVGDTLAIYDTLEKPAGWTDNNQSLGLISTFMDKNPDQGAISASAYYQFADISAQNFLTFLESFTDTTGQDSSVTLSANDKIRKILTSGTPEDAAYFIKAFGIDAADSRGSIIFLAIEDAGQQSMILNSMSYEDAATLSGYLDTTEDGVADDKFLETTAGLDPSVFADMTLTKIDQSDTTFMQNLNKVDSLVLAEAVNTVDNDSKFRILSAMLKNSAGDDGVKDSVPTLEAINSLNPVDSADLFALWGQMNGTEAAELFIDNAYVLASKYLENSGIDVTDPTNIAPEDQAEAYDAAIDYSVMTLETMKEGDAPEFFDHIHDYSSKMSHTYMDAMVKDDTGFALYTFGGLADASAPDALSNTQSAFLLSANSETAGKLIENMYTVDDQGAIDYTKANTALTQLATQDASLTASIVDDMDPAKALKIWRNGATDGTFAGSFFKTVWSSGSLNDLGKVSLWYAMNSDERQEIYSDGTASTPFDTKYFANTAIADKTSNVAAIAPENLAPFGEEADGKTANAQVLTVGTFLEGALSKLETITDPNILTIQSKFSYQDLLDAFPDSDITPDDYVAYIEGTFLPTVEAAMEKMGRPANEIDAALDVVRKAATLATSEPSLLDHNLSFTIDLDDPMAYDDASSSWVDDGITETKAFHYVNYVSSPDEATTAPAAGAEPTFYQSTPVLSSEEIIRHSNTIKSGGGLPQIVGASGLDAPMAVLTDADRLELAELPDNPETRATVVGGANELELFDPASHFHVTLDGTISNTTTQSLTDAATDQSVKETTVFTLGDNFVWSSFADDAAATQSFETDLKAQVIEYLTPLGFTESEIENFFWALLNAAQNSPDQKISMVVRQGKVLAQDWYDSDGMIKSDKAHLVQYQNGTEQTSLISFIAFSDDFDGSKVGWDGQNADDINVNETQQVNTALYNGTFFTGAQLQGIRDDFPGDASDGSNSFVFTASDIDTLPAYVTNNNTANVEWIDSIAENSSRSEAIQNIASSLGSYANIFLQALKTNTLQGAYGAALSFMDGDISGIMQTTLDLAGIGDGSDGDLREHDIYDVASDDTAWTYFLLTAFAKDKDQLDTAFKNNDTLTVADIGTTFEVSELFSHSTMEQLRDGLLQVKQDKIAAGGRRAQVVEARELLDGFVNATANITDLNATDSPTGAPTTLPPTQLPTAAPSANIPKGGRGPSVDIAKILSKTIPTTGMEWFDLARKAIGVGSTLMAVGLPSAHQNIPQPGDNSFLLRQIFGNKFTAKSTEFNGLVWVDRGVMTNPDTGEEVYRIELGYRNTDLAFLAGVGREYLPKSIANFFRLDENPFNQNQDNKSPPAKTFAGNVFNPILFDVTHITARIDIDLKTGTPVVVGGGATFGSYVGNSAFQAVAGTENRPAAGEKTLLTGTLNGFSQSTKPLSAAGLAAVTLYAIGSRAVRPSVTGIMQARGLRPDNTKDIQGQNVPGSFVHHSVREVLSFGGRQAAWMLPMYLTGGKMDIGSLAFTGGIVPSAIGAAKYASTGTLSQSLGALGRNLAGGVLNFPPVATAATPVYDLGAWVSDVFNEFTVLNVDFGMGTGVAPDQQGAQEEPREVELIRTYSRDSFFSDTTDGTYVPPWQAEDEEPEDMFAALGGQAPLNPLGAGARVLSAIQAADENGDIGDIRMEVEDPETGESRFIQFIKRHGNIFDKSQWFAFANIGEPKTIYEPEGFNFFNDVKGDNDGRFLTSLSMEDSNEFLQFKARLGDLERELINPDTGEKGLHLDNNRWYGLVDDPMTALKTLETYKLDIDGDGKKELVFGDLDGDGQDGHISNPLAAVESLENSQYLADNYPDMDKDFDGDGTVGTATNLKPEMFPPTGADSTTKIERLVPSLESVFDNRKIEPGTFNLIENEIPNALEPSDKIRATTSANNTLEMGAVFFQNSWKFIAKDDTGKIWDLTSDLLSEPNLHFDTETGILMSDPTAGPLTSLALAYNSANDSLELEVLGTTVNLFTFDDTTAIGKGALFDFTSDTAHTPDPQILMAGEKLRPGEYLQAKDGGAYSLHSARVAGEYRLLIIESDTQRIWGDVTDSAYYFDKRTGILAVPSYSNREYTLSQDGELFLHKTGEVPDGGFARYEEPYEGTAQTQKAMVQWQNLNQTYDEDIPSLEAKQVFDLLYGFELDSYAIITEGTWQTLFSSNFDETGQFIGSETGELDFSMFGDDRKAQVKDAVEVGAIMFHSMQKHVEGTDEADNALFLPDDPLVAQQKFLAALRTDMGFSTTETSTHDHEFYLSGILDPSDTGSTPLTDDVMNNKVLLDSIKNTFSQVSEEMAGWTENPYDGPTIADINADTLADDYALYDVKYTKNGVEYKTVATETEKQKLIYLESEGEVTFNPSTDSNQITDPARLKVFHMMKGIADYEANREANYEDGNQSGGVSAATLITQDFAARHSFYNDEKTAAGGGATTSILSETFDGRSSGMYDKEAGDLAYQTLGVDGSNLASLFSALKGATDVSGSTAWIANDAELKPLMLDIASAPQLAAISGKVQDSAGIAVSDEELSLFLKEKWADLQDNPSDPSTWTDVGVWMSLDMAYQLADEYGSTENAFEALLATAPGASMTHVGELIAEGTYGIATPYEYDFDIFQDNTDVEAGTYTTVFKDDPEDNVTWSKSVGLTAGEHEDAIELSENIMEKLDTEGLASTADYVGERMKALENPAVVIQALELLSPDIQGDIQLQRDKSVSAGVAYQSTEWNNAVNDSSITAQVDFINVLAPDYAEKFLFEVSKAQGLDHAKDLLGNGDKVAAEKTILAGMAGVLQRNKDYGLPYSAPTALSEEDSFIMDIMLSLSDTDPAKAQEIMIDVGLASPKIAAVLTYMISKFEGDGESFDRAAALLQPDDSTDATASEVIGEIALNLTKMEEEKSPDGRRLMEGGETNNQTFAESFLNAVWARLGLNGPNDVQTISLKVLLYASSTASFLTQARSRADVNLLLASKLSTDFATKILASWDDAVDLHKNGYTTAAGTAVDISDPKKIAQGIVEDFNAATSETEQDDVIAGVAELLMRTKKSDKVGAVLGHISARDAENDTKIAFKIVTKISQFADSAKKEKTSGILAHIASDVMDAIILNLNDLIPADRTTVADAIVQSTTNSLAVGATRTLSSLIQVSGIGTSYFIELVDPVNTDRYPITTANYGNIVARLPVENRKTIMTSLYDNLVTQDFALRAMAAMPAETLVQMLLSIKLDDPYKAKMMLNKMLELEFNLRRTGMTEVLDLLHQQDPDYLFDAIFILPFASISFTLNSVSDETFTQIIKGFHVDSPQNAAIIFNGMQNKAVRFSRLYRLDQTFALILLETLYAKQDVNGVDEFALFVQSLLGSNDDLLNFSEIVEIQEVLHQNDTGADLVFFSSLLLSSTMGRVKNASEYFKSFIQKPDMAKELFIEASLSDNKSMASRFIASVHTSTDQEVKNQLYTFMADLYSLSPNVFAQNLTLLLPEIGSSPSKYLMLLRTARAGGHNLFDMLKSLVDMPNFTIPVMGSPLTFNGAFVAFEMFDFLGKEISSQFYDTLSDVQKSKIDNYIDNPDTYFDHDDTGILGYDSKLTAGLSLADNDILFSPELQASFGFVESYRSNGYDLVILKPGPQKFDIKDINNNTIKVAQGSEFKIAFNGRLVVVEPDGKIHFITKALEPGTFNPEDLRVVLTEVGNLIFFDDSTNRVLEIM